MKTVEKILEGPGTRSVEDVHHLRLMALLKDMVRELGPVEAAEALGIDRKTVWRGLSKGRLSPRLADALERLLLSESVADAAGQLERIKALEGGGRRARGGHEGTGRGGEGGVRGVQGAGFPRSGEERGPLVRAGRA